MGLFLLLFLAAVLVQLRTAFRLAESAQGVFGYLSSREVYFGCLEFLPIVLAVGGLVYLGRASHQSLASSSSSRASCSPVPSVQQPSMELPARAAA